MLGTRADAASSPVRVFRDTSSQVPRKMGIMVGRLGCAPAGSRPHLAGRRRIHGWAKALRSLQGNVNRPKSHVPRAGHPTRRGSPRVASPEGRRSSLQSASNAPSPLASSKIPPTGARSEDPRHEHRLRVHTRRVSSRAYLVSAPCPSPATPGARAPSRGARRVLRPPVR